MKNNTMNIAYLILAHNNPRLLDTLMAQLDSDQAQADAPAHSTAPSKAHFFLHIDRKADIAPFLGLADRYPHLHFCRDRVDGAWAHFSLVEATLRLMRQAMQTLGTPDRVVLLSGATLPVQPPAYIARFFARERGANYMDAFAMPNEEYGKGLGRLEHYWIRRSPPMHRYRWMLQDFINAHLPRRNFRRAFGPLQPAAGSQWWAITGEACRYVLDYVSEHPRFMRFCHHTDCPDEFFFQTILWNSPFKESLRPTLTYTDWRPGKQSPEAINGDTLAQFAQDVVFNSPHNNSPLPPGEVLFARKFDEQDWPVIEQLVALLQAKAARQAAAPLRESA